MPIADNSTQLIETEQVMFLMLGPNIVTPRFITYLISFGFQQTHDACSHRFFTMSWAHWETVFIKSNDLENVSIRSLCQHNPVNPEIYLIVPGNTLGKLDLRVTSVFSYVP